jgi:antitoxin FitA
MGVLVQIREVPEPVHRTLKARAAASGMSLSEYLRVQLERIASRPTPDELSRRIRDRGPIDLGAPAQQLVREIRDGGE